MILNEIKEIFAMFKKILLLLLAVMTAVLPFSSCERSNEEVESGTVLTWTKRY